MLNNPPGMQLPPTIEFKDISVVVQGGIDPLLTPITLRSIRHVLPGATTILSTWSGSNTTGLDFDRLIMRTDPGAASCDLTKNIKNNVNRQIESTRNGLLHTSTPYALKIRSDIELTSPAFIDYFRNHNAHGVESKPHYGRYVKNRIVINNLYCANPHKTSFCFHFSDWVQFGLTNDLLNLWDIPLQPIQFNDYFDAHRRPIIDPVPTWTFKYIPEQYIWKTFLEKNGAKLHFDHFTDCRDLGVSNQSFAKNLIIVNYEDFGIRFRKFDPYKFDYCAQLTHLDWLKI